MTMVTVARTTAFMIWNSFIEAENSVPVTAREQLVLFLFHRVQFSSVMLDTCSKSSASVWLVSGKTASHGGIFNLLNLISEYRSVQCVSQ